VRIDGRSCDLGNTIAYKGMMLSDVPNLALAFGYTNASWTLKADLTAGYVCRSSVREPSFESERSCRRDHRRRARILVGRDAAIISLMERLVPVNYWRVLGPRLRR
jgi:cation diffusion facilitator CzcD-associated flavoprotein CzcO